MSIVKDKKSLLAELKASFSFAHELLPHQLELLIADSTLEEVEAGTVLAEKIGNCPGLALILAGKLRVYKTSADGREITLYRIGKGRTCPLSAVCILGHLEGYLAKVVAEVDTRILWLSRDFVSNSMVKCEPFWRYLFGCMAGRLYETMEVVDNIAFIPIKKRLTQILVEKSNFGKHAIYTTHEALARELGTAREVVSRELKGLERLGILSLSRGRITVEKAEELEKIVGNVKFE